MTKKERVLCAMSGGEPDCVPVGYSVHFPAECRCGEAAVQAHLKFFEETDTDILKVMNENLIPDMGPIKTPEDWKQVRSMSLQDAFMQDQLEITKRVIAETDHLNAYRIGTLHGICASSIHPIEHRYGYDAVRRMLCEHLRENRQPVLDAMNRIADVLCSLARGYVENGMDGVYYAALGGEHCYFTDEEFAAYIEPFDLQIMKAIREAGGAVYLHICKNDLNMERYRAYAPYADVVNWGVYEAPYSISEGRGLFAGCTIMGGLPHTRDCIPYAGSEADIRAGVAQVLRTAGRKNFILGADCTLPEDISIRNLRLVVEAARSEDI